MLDVMKKVSLLLLLLILMSACSSTGEGEEIKGEVLDITLLNLAGVEEVSDLKFVIYNAEGIEVIENRVAYVDALEQIQVIYMEQSDDTSNDGYGLMDIGNGIDSVKRVHLISSDTIAIEDITYTISKGQDLMALVIEDRVSD